MTRRLLIGLLVGLVAASAVRADKVRTRAGIGYTGTITGMDPSGLIIEGPAGTRTVPLADIEEIQVEKHPALGEAEKAFEQATRGGPGAATAFRQARLRYEALMSDRIPDWMKLLIRSRLVRLYAQEGQVSEALEAYLALARAEPQLVEGLSLPRPRRGEDRENRALLAKVDAALKGAEGRPYARELQRLRVALVLEVGTPEQRLPLIRQALQSDRATTRQWARRRMLDLLLEMDRLDEADRVLDEARGEEDAAHLAYYRGRILAGQDKPVEAAIELMRVPVLYGRSDRDLAAESLYRAGMALTGADWPKDEIRKVYGEAARDYAATPWGERARRALASLGP